MARAPHAWFTVVRQWRAALGAVAVGIAFAPAPALADGSPWLAAPGTGYASVSFVQQTAEDLFAGERRVAIDGGGKELSQGTVWLLGNYALSDNLGVDAQIGFAMGDFDGMTTADTSSFNGRADTSFGITWRLVDEVASSMPSLAVRIGAIVAGDYEPGHINSLGDGGDGTEASLIVGKFLGDRFGFSLEAGVRDRNSGIPTNYFGNLAAILLVNDKLALGADYKVVRSEPGLDIGGPGFWPPGLSSPRFPMVREERTLYGGRMFYSFSQKMSMGLFYLVVDDGRNTPASSAFGGSLSYSFGGP